MVEFEQKFLMMSRINKKLEEENATLKRKVEELMRFNEENLKVYYLILW
jgi:hypothetical protein